MLFNFTTKDVLIIFSLALPKFIVGFMTSMVIPIFPSLIQSYVNVSIENYAFNQSLTNRTSSYSYQQLSMLYTTKNILQVIISPFSGFIIECIGSLPVLLIGSFCHVIMILLYGLGNSYHILLFGRIFEAIASTLICCVAAAYTSVKFVDQKQQGFVFGITGFILSIGGSVGPVYGGSIYEYYGKAKAFLLTLPIIIIECIFSIVIFLMEKFINKRTQPKIYIIEEIVLEESDTNFKESDLLSISSSEFTDVNQNEINIPMNKKKNPLMETSLEEIHPPKISYKDILLFAKDPYILILIGSILIIYFSLFLLFSSLPLYMAKKFNCSESQQGLIWISSFPGYIVGFVVGNVVNSHLSKYKHISMIVYTLLHATAIIFIPFMPTWWSIGVPLCIIVNVQMMAEVVLSPLFVIIVQEKHSSKFGIMSGIIMMSVGITASLGSYLGPVLLSTIGYVHTNIGMCIINIIFAPFYMFLKRFCK